MLLYTKLNKIFTLNYDEELKIKSYWPELEPNETAWVKVVGTQNEKL